MLNFKTKTHLYCITAGVLAIASGCNGVGHRAAANAHGTYVPPFSSIAPGALQPGSVAASAVASSPNSSPPLIPPPIPGTSLPPLAVPAQLPPVASAETLAAPAGVGLPPALAPSVVESRQLADVCVPVEPEWKRTLEAQAQAMQHRLNSMDSELAQNRIRMESVTNNLTTSQQRIAQLNQELNTCRAETKRLDAEMRQQQESDLKSLDELAGAVNGLISKQRLAQAGQP